MPSHFKQLDGAFFEGQDLYFSSVFLWKLTSCTLFKKDVLF